MRFSVVIPTRNRASCLVHAIRSALAQRFDDYEVVISNNDSSDETESIVRQFDSPRIKYFRTDRPLSMADHWEFAVGKTSGEWILYLCDDDALMRDCLPYLEDVILSHPDVAAVQMGHLTYVYGDGIVASGNYLKCKGPVPVAVDVVPSRRTLGAVYRTMSGDMPKFLNASVRRDLVATIRQRHGRVFHHWAPDYSSGVLLLAHTDKYVVAHRPLMVWGKNMLSYGAGARADPGHLRRFLSEYPEFDGRFPCSPYPDLLTVTNCIYDTLDRIREKALGPTRGLEVDLRRFRQLLLSDVLVYIENGHEEFRQHLERIARDSRTAFPALTSARESLWRELRRTWRRLRARLTGRRTKIKVVYGQDQGAGFRNIYEAAEFAWNWQRRQGSGLS